ncbi:prolyl 4-hydroxylase subunit alpha-1-like [Limulus polyphemus]|uniref:procollagen-proline 4-dioxygenase n=1 Tax=Limulus polyphemus TaxID=6850 RepID=A0ABM1SJP9_LIMPO|nr:prolyl 4-hydroxylase subunit alpha-1-like [Limulus polyphemus]
MFWLMSISMYISMLVLPAKTDMFTAIIDLQKLLYTEAEIIKTLELYLKAEEQRLEKVRQLRQEYGQMYQLASQDMESFIANPVNAYLLVKRLTADWKNVEYLMLEGEGKNLIENITRNRDDLKFPDDDDLNGAAVALLRLQDTYKIDTSVLAKGYIQGTKHSSELTAGDCFELGRQSYNNEDFYHTVLWMQEALERAEEEIDKTADAAEVLEYLAYATYKQGNTRHALKLTSNLLKLVPDHPRAGGNKIFFENSLQRSEKKKKGDDGDVPVEETYMEFKRSVYDIPEREKYEMLCRGEKLMNKIEEGKLKCHYYTNNHPYYLLQPVKEEEAFLRPRIVMYHNILSDKEIEVVKTLATPLLKRATVQNYKSGELEMANYRICKSAWLSNQEHEIVAKISQRIEDLTGLTMSTAEELQVVNYGIGGHYEPHFDFSRREETNAFQSLGTGNRIATWLNYMSDVEGGATVFPHISVAVWPKKGSAAFWYNLFKSGEGDMLTRHAACPVLAGSKWVSNKWIHERGQEFRRKCGLHFTD